MKLTPKGLFLCIMAATLLFSQTVKLNDVRLSPRLLNYQGYLTDTLGNPVTNPSLSLSFAIFDSPSAGTQKWSETQGSVAIDKGIFNVLLGSVTPIPDSVFTNSTNRYLQLTVAGQVLTPRTQIVATPYAYIAIYSDTAQYARNSAPDNDWTFLISDGADTTLQTGGRWGLARTGNVLYGIYDSTHVNFGVACTTGTSGLNKKYCTIGGGRNNTSRDNNATIGGGYNNTASGASATVGGGFYNTASNVLTTIGGGENNTASGVYATIAGGRNNTASEYDAAVGGGYSNIGSGNCATVGGGYDNTASDTFATVAGGTINEATAWSATVGGGYYNAAYGRGATAGGGYDNVATGIYATIGGGYSNASGSYATVGGGNNNTASGYNATVGGGYYNSNSGDYSAILSGYANTITATGDYSYLFGINSNLTQDSTFMVDMPHIRFGKESNGYEFPVTDGSNGQVLMTNGAGQIGWGTAAGGGNQWTFLVSDGADTTLQTSGRWGLARAGNVLYGNADSTHVNFGVACTTGTSGQNYGYCAVGGGYGNSASGEVTTVGGGWRNTTSGGNVATVSGGELNNASNYSATVGGGSRNTASASYATVAGGRSNVADSMSAFIGGGYYNTASASYATVAGGRNDTASGYASTVAGGSGNAASGERSTVSGGSDNTAGSGWATVSGGYGNTASNVLATVGGGGDNIAGGSCVTIAGGANNKASDGDYATVCGGLDHMVRGYGAIVGGGKADSANGIYAGVLSGYSNLAGDATTDTDTGAVIAGGWNNAATAKFATVGGGYANNAAGDYSAIVGGYGNTITATGDYSYLFGMNSTLTQDSTFLVSMPYTCVSGNVGIGLMTPAEKLDVNGAVNVSTVYKINGDTVLAVPDSNTFVGIGAGISNYGNSNTFVGRLAGSAYSNGSANTYVGTTAGRDNQGNSNTYIGHSAGISSASGDSNTYVGAAAGHHNVDGISNTFIGFQAGYSNLYGSGNVFIGNRAGSLELGNNTLYIDNIGEGDPLIYGDFSANSVTINGDFNVTGTKNFEIDHPAKSGHKLVHSCLEGPEAGVYYRGEAKLSNGEALVALPEYFEKLTRKEGRTVHLTPMGTEPFIVSYTGIADGAFKVYGRKLDGSKADGAFSWEVMAVRADVDPLQVEISAK